MILKQKNRLKMIKPFKLSLFIAIISSSLYSQTITVAAASNLKYAMDNIVLEFTKETGISVKPIFGASGKLTQQILSGAPYDVFLSADMEFPSKLAQNGSTLTNPKVYGYGTLVLWSANQTPLKGGISDLCSRKNLTLAIANPKTAPYGIEAMNALHFYNENNTCNAKIVTAESISQVGSYVTTQAADVGFIAKSIVLSDEMRKVGNWVDINPKAYKPIDQGMVMLKSNSADNQAAAKRFFDFMSSPKAQSILKRNGYIVPKP
jgi:molybdate transport system substrate-binding protein